jgi:DNA replication and repair protein RecF
MIVTDVHIRNFRNHSESTVNFGEGINGLLGKNGQGKTNILEAISFLCLTKSFHAANDATVLQIGKDFFEVEGTIVSDTHLSHTVRVTYTLPESEKQFTINHTRPETLGSVIGRFPVVILSPENNAVTFGGPADRRRFIDLILSQLSQIYLGDLMEYRQVVKQRNRILSEARLNGRDCGKVIEPWNISLARYGGRIILQRERFVNEFQRYVGRAYAGLVEAQEEPMIEYVSSCKIEDRNGADAIAAVLAEEIEKAHTEELRRGLTLVGPHRDDMRMRINGISVQKYASQGQHKTLQVALKVAEFFYLKERRNEAPIFLLDDVFSELDQRRAQHILNLVDSLGQTVITTTDESAFHGKVSWNGRNRKFYVEAGTCRPG